ncbi:MAG: dihydropteroate synthase [Candidatus Cloacimonadota bacterium]|nr:dihydropteroate synthase [Candidatus Cloacimonadota bacterium]
MDRILNIENEEQAREELRKIGVSRRGIAAMCSKMQNLNLKLMDLEIAAANILKQEMLKLGTDAAVAAGVVEGELNSTDVILMGNIAQFKKLDLSDYKKFQLPKIEKKIKELLNIYFGKEKKMFDCGGVKMELNSTKLMGILNVTPDSFSDGSKYNTVEKAVRRALQMEEEGADIIDIGGESTRPGAPAVSNREEIKRVIPVIEELRHKSSIPISVDTRKAEVARKAILKGANIVNDVSALRYDNKMISVLQEFSDIPIIIMHMQGSPKNMQKNPYYVNVIDEIMEFLQERIDFCVGNKVDKTRIIIDPGIGFGKRYEDNLKILLKLGEFRSLGVPVLLGASRKSFLKNIYNDTTENRISGTLATTALAHKNKIDFVRIHDVKENYRFIKTLEEVESVK